MNEQLQNAIQALKQKFGCEENIHRGEHTLFVNAVDIFEASKEGLKPKKTYDPVDLKHF